MTDHEATIVIRRVAARRLLIVMGLLWLFALGSSTAMFVMIGRYQNLRDTLDRDCRGVVANLDLTEWVEVCR